MRRMRTSRLDLLYISGAAFCALLVGMAFVPPPRHTGRQFFSSDSAGSRSGEQSKPSDRVKNITDKYVVSAAADVVAALTKNASGLASTGGTQSGSGLHAGRNGPTADTVIAGRAASRSSVTPRRDGILNDEGSDQMSALFAPRPLLLGEHRLRQHNIQGDNPIVTLRGSIQATSQLENDAERVAALSEHTTLADEAAAGNARSLRRADVKILGVEANESGKLSVVGQAPPGATVGLYLDGSYVTSAVTSASGEVVFSISRGVIPGEDRVRLDLIEGVTPVRSSAEQLFAAPAAKRRASVAAEAPKEVVAESPKPVVASKTVSTSPKSEPTRAPSEQNADLPLSSASPGAAQTLGTTQRLGTTQMPGTAQTPGAPTPRTAQTNSSIETRSSSLPSTSASANSRPNAMHAKEAAPYASVAHSRG